jgi:DNA-3-methyladenine glycosylase
VDTVELTRYLIGKVVVHDTDSGRLSGRIVETEAYPVGDAAGHAYHGKTQRNQSLFLERGHAYVYLSYGTSYLLNVTSEVAGVGAGVLLRAIEPLEGIDSMMAGSCGTTRLADLGRGPGRLPRHCGLILTKTDWTCALPARFGWPQPHKGLAGSAKALASASPAMQIGCCVFTNPVTHT